jgi:hypothetical protein
MEDASWNFVNQKWKDSLNMGAAEPASWDQGADYRRGPDGPKRGEREKPAVKKAPSVGVQAAIASSDRGVSQGPGQTPQEVQVC